MIAALVLGLPVFLLGLMLVLSAVEDRIVSPPSTPQPSVAPNAPGTQAP
ncbi:hypothetical protein [Actinacidiphila glaucinigra]|nr:hypothetical protein [Actinacidiphila glaucinigra]